MKIYLHTQWIFIKSAVFTIISLFVAFLDGAILSSNNRLPHLKSVLIVKVDSIGDFILWLDSAHSLIAHYHSSGYSVTLLCNSSWANFARDLNLADDIWSIDPLVFNRTIRYRWSWIRKISQHCFSVTVHPTYSRFFLDGDSLVRASLSAERIGFFGDETNISSFLKSRSNRWYTKLINVNTGLVSEIKRNTQFIYGMGIKNYEEKWPFIPKLITAPINSFLTDGYAVLALMANWSGREWPINNFVQLAYKLQKAGFLVVLVGASGNHFRVSELVSNFPPNVISLINKTSLSQLTEVLRGAKIVISNETSTVHISTAVNTPVVCILGGGHFGRFLPYENDSISKGINFPISIYSKMPCFGCNWKCKYPLVNGAAQCISNVSVEVVWDSIKKLIFFPKFS